MQQSDQRQDQSAAKQTDKKPYTTPQLQRHGQVEEVTEGQFPIPGTSQPPTVSDRNLKENFARVDVQRMLEKLADLPITRWNYKDQPPTVRHIGPMAQDFAQAFGVGDSDRVIHPVDASGVTIAAIQALYQLVQDQNLRIATLEAQVREMRDAGVAV